MGSPVHREGSAPGTFGAASCSDAVPASMPVLGPFRVEVELGAGGMGTVYRAEVVDPTGRLEPGRRVALKVVHPHLLGERQFLERFRREAEIGQSVRHANVVRTLDALEIDGAQVLVMEYAEGRTLRALLDELGRLPEALCRAIGRDLCAGLAAIHEAGVIHRDLKPENVIIGPDQRSVKIMDLGLARVADEALRLSIQGAFVGSVRYAAPEQFHNEGADIDHRVDLHGLGVLLYELATGVHPYEAEEMPELIGRVLHDRPRSLGELQPDVTPFFEEVVHTLLAKEREARFPTARALFQVLREGEASAWWRQRAQELRAATNGPPRRIQLVRETALFGRERELEALRSVFTRARDGEGQVLLLEGEAGIGKTRLVDEFVRRIQADGEPVHLLVGSYPRAGAATAAGAFSTAYREHLGEGGGSAYLAETPLLVEAFDALLAGRTVGPDAQPLTPTSLATCFVHVTRGLARERPTVVLIEDLQLAPPEGRRLFAELARSVAGHRVLLCGTFRPDVPSEWLGELAGLEELTHLELPRLGMQDVLRLLHEAFHSERIASTLTEPVWRRSAGNPFFVFEIVRGLQESGLVGRDDDSKWSLTAALDRVAIPSSVREIVDARTDALAPDERELLDVAACWGHEFDPRLVAEALDLPHLEALRHFRRLESRYRIVRASGQNYVFDHPQIQEALQHALLPEVRRRYHTALARSLEVRRQTASAEDEGADGAAAVDLCEHYLRSDAPEHALRYLDVALDHLEAGYLHAESPTLAARALAVPGLLEGRERVAVLLRMASRLDLLGRRDLQLDACREAESVARDVADADLHVRACRALGVAHLRVSDHDPATAWLERALAEARESGLRTEEAAATGDLGTLHWAEGRVAEAEAHHERHLALARALRDRVQEARAMLNLGNVLLTRGRPDAARARYDELLALAHEAGDRRSVAAALGNLGSVLYLQGHLEAARERLGRAMSAAQELGDRRGEARILGNLGAVLQAEGRFAEASALLRRALTLSREVGDRRGEANVLSNLSDVALAQGDLQASVDHARQNLDLSRKACDPQGEALALLGLARGARLLGDPAVARSRYDWALDAARRADLRAVEAPALAGLGDLLADAGAREEGAARHQEALTLYRAMGDGRGVGASHLAVAAARAEAGDAAVAREAAAEAYRRAQLAKEPGLLVRAAACAAQLGVIPVHEAQAVLDRQAPRAALFDRMEAAWRLGRVTGDAARRGEARRLLEEATGHAPPEFRSSMVENVPLHRQIAAG